MRAEQVTIDDESDGELSEFRELAGIATHLDSLDWSRRARLGVLTLTPSARVAARSTRGIEGDDPVRARRPLTSNPAPPPAISRAIAGRWSPLVLSRWHLVAAAARAGAL
jgi:hypothetical protein